MMRHLPRYFSRWHRLVFLAFLWLTPLPSSNADQQLEIQAAPPDQFAKNSEHQAFQPTTAKSRAASPGYSERSIDLLTAIERVAEETIPAVVHVEVTERHEVAHPLQPFMEEPFFRRFFGGPRVPETFEQEIQSIGSGMIMDRHGRILTNYHVVSGASRIEILLADGSSYPAELIGGDSKTDLAVLHIVTDADLPHVVFGDSDEVRVGQWVVAIGHPRGLSQTVTQGIISAKHRTGLIDPSNYQDFLQTDTAINPGNSGGPLLNLRGEVIGVNAAIATTTGGFQGIGFAIPSNMALFVAGQLIDQGEVRRGWLGLNVQDVTPSQARELGLQASEGALVVGVIEDSPAARAGLQEGDIILSYEERRIRDAAILRNEVAVTPAGQEARLTIWRDGAEQEIRATISSQEQAHEVLISRAAERLGGSFRPPSPELTEEFGLQQGAEVVSISPGGPLAQAGFKAGDLILSIEDQPVDSPETLAIILSQLPAGQPVVLLALDRATAQIGYIQVVPD
jgi:serine protease Do